MSTSPHLVQIQGMKTQIMVFSAQLDMNREDGGDRPTYMVFAGGERKYHANEVQLLGPSHLIYEDGKAYTVTHSGVLALIDMSRSLEDQEKVSLLELGDSGALPVKYHGKEEREGSVTLPALRRADPAAADPETVQTVKDLTGKDPTVDPITPRQARGLMAKGINLTKAGVHAGKSLAKTALKIDVATPEEQQARLATCRQCPTNSAIWKDASGRKVSNPSFEQLEALRNDPQASVYTCGPMLKSMASQGLKTCGCILSKKVADRKEECPQGYWTAITVEGEKPA